MTSIPSHDPESEADDIPTLADVARLAGVSTATVSRTLNSPTQVQEHTREKVMAAVIQLGYAPNFSARALAAKRTNTVGAIIPTMENAIFAQGLQAFQEELDCHGITLLVASSSYREDREAQQIRALVARGADALLLIGYHRDPELYAMLKKRKVPAVIAWAHDPSRDLPAIGFDNTGAMAQLTRAVLDQGHTRIAMISAETKANDRARSRVAGVRQALREAGHDPAALPVIETPYGIDTGRAALDAVLDKAPETTAILCGNDVLAIGALQGAKARGLTIPRDLSITGFDDIDLAKFADPALTTVHVPHARMGTEAARMLVSMVGEIPAPDCVALPTEIRFRETLGPAPETSAH